MNTVKKKGDEIELESSQTDQCLSVLICGSPLRVLRASLVFSYELQ